MSKIQVGKTHYNFSDYMIKRRWISIWSQLSEISKLKPKNVLEIGPGLGILKAVGKLHDLNITTLDMDPELSPDTVGDVLNIPFDDGSFEVVCAFQVLEHLPYETFIPALRELKRITSDSIIISLSNAKEVWRFHIYVPKLGDYEFMFPRPFWKPPLHKFDGEHYWEINKKNYELNQVVSDISSELEIVKHWRLWENPYHHFFLLKA